MSFIAKDFQGRSEIYFARHGESVANASGVIAGWLDSPLTQKGVAQAQSEAVFMQHAGLKFDIIFSSPLSRAFDTANIIARHVDYSPEKIIVIDDLREKNGGTYEGALIGSLNAATDEDIVAAGGETFEVFAERVKRANSEIVRLARGRCLVVAHSGLYRMALCVHNNLPPSSMSTILKPGNGKLMKYPL